MEGNHSFNPETRNIENEGFQRQVKERFTFIANENIILDYFVDHQIYGKTDFILTNWALRIIVHNWIENNKDFTIPLKCIISIDKKGGRKRPGYYGIDILLSTTAHLLIPFDKNKDERPRIYKTLTQCCKSPLSLETSVYECDHSWEDGLQQKSGWSLIDNDFCATYPKKILIPQGISHDTIKEVARFRSKGRVPFLSYVCPPMNTPLLRSAQPLTGISNMSSPADSEYLSHINENRSFQIYDCRPKLNAIVNIFTGGGYESPGDYTNASFLFFNIPNIHKVRDCYKEMRDGLDNNIPNSYDDWGNLIMQIVNSSIIAAQSLLDNKAVLVHCTDGWDRTAQIDATAQILIDPYARTINGFKTLIQKEWCDAGHQFGLRCSHLPVTKMDQNAPIFVQFIDVVLQIMKDHPQAFEFNEKLPIYLAFHAYSQLYGDFLFSNSQERDSKPRPISIWTNLENEAFMTSIKNADFHESSEPITEVSKYRLSHELHNPLIFGGGLNLPVI